MNKKRGQSKDTEEGEKGDKKQERMGKEWVKLHVREKAIRRSATSLC